MRIDPRSGLTETQVQFLFGELLEQQQELLQAQQELLDQQRGPAERAEAHQRRMRATEEALARIDEGSYGLDVTSGEPIGFERLAIEPWARHTQATQEDVERERAPGRP